jgi:Flp pilus assembly protein CpaB
MPGKGKAQEKSPLVTLALTPEEANILAFLQEQGKIRLSIRGTTDSQIHTVKPVTWENIFQYLPDLRPQEEQVESVEIYRGLNKERLPLSK